MALQPLYPPILPGTTPPFYTKEKGTYLLTVPFSLNKLNLIQDIGGVKLKIRDADTDIELARVNAIPTSISLSLEGCQATFDLSHVNGINVGKYYKIQLAYLDIDNVSNIGYYSTISIVKCTAYPTVSILGLTSSTINGDITYYTGKYKNLDDPTEKSSSYQFTLYDDNENVLITTGWTAHNANTNDTKYESTDNYTLSYVLNETDRYKIQYSVTTQNGLVVHSPMYILSGSSSISPLIDVVIDAQLNYDNGCVDVWLNPSKKYNNLYQGTFMLSRMCSKDNYKSQIQIFSFMLKGELPNKPVFHDFTVEHGYTYKYTLQQYNTYNIYSSRLYSNTVEVYFEDAFLFDGHRQLKIRFNPKVSSFKTVIQDTKKNTLGSKYPFFFRNGIVEYKEFPISGLISYLMDENEFFFQKTTELNMDPFFEPTTNIVDQNISYERRFKMAVLDWLNDGCLKLFRSPAEGNYLVRLSNVSLSPTDTVSRMLHTFSCTADEIADCTPTNLQHYGFLDTTSELETLALRFATINFDNYIETLIGTLQHSSNTANASAATVEAALEEFAHTDLFDGRQCVYFKFDECEPGETWFTFGNEKYVIGATGSYEVTLPNNSEILSLHIVNPHRHMSGSLTFGIYTSKSSVFDAVNGITNYDIITAPPSSTKNYMSLIENEKEHLRNILFMHFTLKDNIYLIESIESWQATYNFYLERITVPGSMPTSVITYKVIFNDDDQIHIEPQEQEQYEEDGTTPRLKYPHYSDLFTDGAVFYCPSTNRSYIYNATMNTIREQTTINPAVSIAGQTAPIILSSTQICIDNEIIDVAEKGYFDVPFTTAVPFQLYWGNSVNATLGYSIINVTYGVEGKKEKEYAQTESLYNLYGQYSEATKAYLSNALSYVRLTAKTNRYLQQLVRNSAYDSSDNRTYFIWDDTVLGFIKLQPEDCAIFTGKEVWMPLPYSWYIDGWKGAKTKTVEINHVTYTLLNGSQQSYLSKKAIYFQALSEVLTLNNIGTLVKDHTVEGNTSDEQPVITRGIIYEDSGRTPPRRF